MDTQYNKERYGGPIFRPSVIPRTISNGITTPNFTLKCKVGPCCVPSCRALLFLILVFHATGHGGHQDPGG
jgi:hypothetical protein